MGREPTRSAPLEARALLDYAVARAAAAWGLASLLVFDRQPEATGPARLSVAQLEALDELMDAERRVEQLSRRAERPPRSSRLGVGHPTPSLPTVPRALAADPATVSMGGRRPVGRDGVVLRLVGGRHVSR